MPEGLTFADLGIRLHVVAPELALFITAILVMFVDMFAEKPVKKDDPRQPDRVASNAELAPARRFIPWLALGGVIATGYICFTQWNNEIATFQGAAILDRFALGGRFVILTALALGILLSVDYIPRVNRQTGEYYALLLLAGVGMTMMVAATDLITVFLALEILSLALYILCGINRQEARSTEAAMKYFLLGAFASAFFVYGAALIYGATGSTQFALIAEAIAGSTSDVALLFPGIALLIVGFGFKVSLVPFHMWTPDVYQGAPTPVTAFMSVGTKTAAFAAFTRVLVMALPAEQSTWGGLLAILAVLTMTLGNFAALRQRNLKRLLAYSSIAHAGYILTALVPGTVEGANAAIFYLFTYAFMNIGAFAVVIALEKTTNGDASYQHIVGLSQRWSGLALAMAIFMFSLSGIPPLAGFFGKFYVFGAAIEGGYAWLAVIGMLNSAVSAYYYLRITVAMYFQDPDGETATDRWQWGSLNAGLVVAAVFTVLIGILPGFWTGIFQSGVAALALGG